MKYKDKIMWSFNGFDDQNSAEKELEEMLNWFRTSFDYKSYVVTQSVQGTPQGWRAEFTAEKDKG